MAEPTRRKTTRPPTLPPVRSAGVLLHVTSLPGPFGVGDLGPAARTWVDALAAAGQSWWQVLPLNPPGHGDSPYAAYSAFAGNPLLVSPDQLVGDGLLKRSDLKGRHLPPGRVDFPAASALKAHLLGLAWDRFRAGGGGPGLRSALARFRRRQAGWLNEYALFQALRAAHGNAHWHDWEPRLVRRDPAALAAARRAHRPAIHRQAFEQFLFARQWDALKAYAAARAVRLIGDVPIFVSGDSADVWSAPELFLLDRDRRPTVVAGVPPDYFSATGQRWGNPLYNWKAMAADGFAWWTARLRTLLAQTDLVRIDHFRGLAACWHVPASAPTAETGRWVKSPGRDLLATFRQTIGQRLPVIAEDLGVITPDVEALRDDFGLPGMRVLQFAFGTGPGNAFLPHNYLRTTVAYTGTHDNDTTVGWYATLDPAHREQADHYAPGLDADPAATLIRLAWASVADLAVTPAQDVLRLGPDARMNTPGVGHGNWAWRLPGDWADHPGWQHLADCTAAYGRRPVQPDA